MQRPIAWHRYPLSIEAPHIGMSVYDIPLKTIDGNETTLEPFRGKALLIVNVASRCGFTPQYEGLEKLYRRHQDHLVVLGFPSNQFGRQEPGSESEIQEFCSRRYDVTFPLFAKIDVNGPNAHPLYRLLKTAKKGLLGREAIAWNFTKFLVGANGEVLKRYAPRVAPEAIERDLHRLSPTFRSGGL
jgi:glutathione peroxidase